MKRDEDARKRRKEEILRYRKTIIACGLLLGLWALGAGLAFGQESKEAPAPQVTPQPELTKLSPNAKPQGWLPDGGKLDLALPSDTRPTRPLWFNPQLYSFQSTLYRRGPHEISLEGSSSQVTLRSRLGLADLQSELNSSLTYRYKGLFGGIVRPVARLSAGAGQGLWVGQPGGGGLGRYSYVAPEVGLEIVYKGVGLGMTVGYPVMSSQTQRLSITPGGTQPRVPIPAKRAKKNGFDWDRLFDQLSKNVYIVVEDPKASKP